MQSAIIIKYQDCLFGSTDYQSFAKWERKRSISVIEALIMNFYMDGYLDSFNGVLKAVASAISSN